MKFEYKVKCRHKLGWKEIKLYADTDIEEFFNRNGIEYVRNITDTIEHRQLKEIERLNNIIKEAREYIKDKFFVELYDSRSLDYKKISGLLEILKGSDKE